MLLGSQRLIAAAHLHDEKCVKEGSFDGLYRHLALISFLTGNAEEGFADLKAASAGSAAITQIVCPRPLPADEIEGKTVFCGTVQVPEDHAKPDGKRISLDFAILKSHSVYPERDPVVYLQGGPGGSAMVQIPLLAQTFEPFRKTRDVVFWDQRSAGLSGHSVKCFNALAASAAIIAKKQYTSTAIDGSNESNNTIADCLREIEAAGIDISKYNTTENARDIPTIVQALGYESYNLYGISYGTKLALEAMRVAPEGIRSVVIDGVAPPWVKLYDTFALKVSEPIEHVVEQCKADQTCNTTFPELDKIIIETLHAAKAGKVIHQGKPMEPKTIFRPFEERNAKYGNLSMTPYLPAFIYELHRGKEMPTVDLLVGRDFVMPMPGDDDVAKASATLPKAQRSLIGTLADNAVITARINRSNQNVMEELRDEIDAEKNYGRVATLFDAELEKALIAARGSDDAKAASMVTDYAALQNINPSKEALVTFVKTHTGGEASTRLTALIDSMSEAEVAGYFAIIQRDIAKSEQAIIAKKQYTSTAIDGSNESNNTIADCLREIEAAGIDISKYNTTENARDIPTIVQALGYESYNLYGISYGTKLALEAMRVAPEGIRSVVIDGVAPPWVKLYDTFALKVSEPIEHVVEQCKADQTCNTTFPELDKIIIETLHAAKAGKVIHQGKPMEPKTIFRPFEERNAKYGNLSMTPYLPAFIYELHRGKEMPTVDLLVGRDFVMPMPGDDDVAKASATLPKAQRSLIGTLADNAVITARINRSNQNVMEELRDEIDAEKNYGRVATLFDAELEKALIAARGSDDAKAASMVTDYAALQNINPSKEALVTFVKTHTGGEASTRLTALIDSMSEAEVAGYFAIIQRDIAKSEQAFFGDLYLFNYACQEDLPFNSFEGYQKFTAAQKYPYIGDDADDAARFVYGACIPFKQLQRDNWQVPVKSDIPTLSIGSLYDSQTPASWAKLATEELTNAQVFMIPEAGHGALLYQSCVADMGVAFINQPSRKLSNDCAESIKIEWHIPDWAKAAK